MTPRSRSELIQRLQGHPILGIAPKGFRVPLSESARRALEREVGLFRCSMCGQSTVFGANEGATGEMCAECRHLKLRADDLPPEAA